MAPMPVTHLLYSMLQRNCPFVLPSHDVMGNLAGARRTGRPQGSPPTAAMLQGDPCGRPDGRPLRLGERGPPLRTRGEPPTPAPTVSACGGGYSGRNLSTDAGVYGSVLQEQWNRGRHFYGRDTAGIQGNALSSTMARALATIRATTRVAPTTNIPYGRGDPCGRPHPGNTGGASAPRPGIRGGTHYARRISLRRHAKMVMKKYWAATPTSLFKLPSSPKSRPSLRLRSSRPHRSR
jgi:hypothetical protein